MEIILDVLTKALDSNIAYAVLMDICIGFLYLFNILLGTIIGSKEDHFDIRKFLFGVLKALCIMLIIVGVCYILNVFTLTVSLVNGIEISQELVTSLQLLAILFAIGIDLGKEVLEKIKTIKSLKWVSYDDIVVSDVNVAEPTELKG